MPRFILYPYKMGSASGKLLAKTLDALRVYPDRDYRPRPSDVIVNWGSGYIPNWKDSLESPKQVINHWKQVCNAIDKRISFKKFLENGIHTPAISYNREDAIEWLVDGHVVIGRKTLEGTRGEGIIEMTKPSQFQECCMYSLYEETTKEFRVYTFNGKFLDALEKRRDSDMLAANKINYRVRTEENGWVFCHNNVQVPVQVATQAVNAVKALGLVFGGVDVIWNEKQKRAVVLEVNTAPGIFGTTVSLYANAIKQYAETL